MDLTLSQAMTRIKKFPAKAAEEARKEMVNQINIQMAESTRSTGGLARSVKKEQLTQSSYVIYPSKTVGGGKYGTYDLGTLIQKGRPGFGTRYAPRLAWYDGGWHHALHVGPAPAQDFIGPTVRALLEREWSL